MGLFASLRKIKPKSVQAKKIYGMGAKSFRGVDGRCIVSGFQYEQQVFCGTSCNFMVL